MAKTMEFTCPECGEDIFIDEVDATVEDMIAYIKMTCCGCGAEWTDTFRLTYNGYSIGGEVWDKNGEKIVGYEEKSEEEVKPPHYSPPPNSIGGQMVRKMIEAYERQALLKENRG